MAYKGAVVPMHHINACGLALHILQYNRPDLFYVLMQNVSRGGLFPMHAHKHREMKTLSERVQNNWSALT